MRGLLALRAWFIVASVVLWNALLGWVVWRNGGFGSVHDEGALSIIAATCALFCGLSSAICFSPRVRGRLLAPSRAHLYAPAPFALIALACGVLSLGTWAQLIF